MSEDVSRRNLSQMLGGVNSDKRIAAGRRGNPLEQLLAVAGGQLTESELYELIYRSGVDKGVFDGLSDKTKEVVVGGIYKLWKVDKFGRDIEEADRSTFGSVREMTNVIEERSRAKNYAVGGDWLAEATGYLIRGATEQDREERREELGKAYGLPDAYGKWLSRSGDEYKEVGDRKLTGGGLERVKAYLQERLARVDELRTVSNSLDREELSFLTGV